MAAQAFGCVALTLHLVIFMITAVGGQKKRDAEAEHVAGDDRALPTRLVHRPPLH